MQSTAKLLKITQGMRHTNKIYHVGTATVTRIDEMALPNGVPSSLYPDLDACALEAHGRFLSSGSYDPKASTFTQSTSSRKPVELRASGSFLMRLKERRSVSLLISLKLPPDTSAGELQVMAVRRCHRDLSNFSGKTNRECWSGYTSP